MTGVNDDRFSSIEVRASDHIYLCIGNRLTVIIHKLHLEALQIDGLLVRS